MPNASSNAITNSTWSSESAPRSSTNDAVGVTRLIHAEPLDDNLFYAFFYAGHSYSAIGSFVVLA
jgi:hypothetical protein